MHSFITDRKLKENCIQVINFYKIVFYVSKINKYLKNHFLTYLFLYNIYFFIFQILKTLLNSAKIYKSRFEEIT